MIREAEYPQIRAWLHNELFSFDDKFKKSEDRQDLIEYIIELISSASSEAEIDILEQCKEQLIDFIGEKTEAFVVKLIEYLESNKSNEDKCDAPSRKRNLDEDYDNEGGDRQRRSYHLSGEPIQKDSQYGNQQMSSYFASLNSYAGMNAFDGYTEVHQGNFQPPAFSRQNRSQLPENMQYTVKCVNIPLNITEMDLLIHYRSFGSLVAFKLNPQPKPEESESMNGRKKYGEFWGQFASLDAAKACHISPKTIKNNRFLRFYDSFINLVAPEQVNDGMIAEIEEKIQAHSVGKGWRSPFPARNATDFASPADNAEKLAIQKEKREQNAADIQMKYQEFQELKQRTEDINKKREVLLQGQLDQCRLLLSKLNNRSTSTAENLDFAEQLEMKIMNLQQQLREIEEKNTIIVADVSNERADVTTRISPDRSGRGGRFVGQWAGRGGRFGGRGRSLSMDCRPTAIIIQQPSEIITTSLAMTHFTKFGDIARCEVLPEGIVVQFQNRRDAENALANGSNADGNVLQLAWHAL